jgi:GNAT superfamily N-acetyltransferase
MLRNRDASPRPMDQPIEIPRVRYSLDASRSAGGFTTEVWEAPVCSREALASCESLWESLFRSSFREVCTVLQGGCVEHTRDVLYVAYVDGQVAGTTVLTMGRGNPGALLGGIGEVATAAQFRRRGIATTLVALARDDFSRLGGELLGLGTVNWKAARLYRQLGFTRLGGCDAWYCNCRDARSPEEYMVDYFRRARSAAPPRYVNGSGAQWPCTILEGTPAERASAMMLVHWVGTSDDMLLDANIGLFSPRMEIIESAMGVYVRYEKLRAGNSIGNQPSPNSTIGPGTWFTAHSAEGQLVGLATCLGERTKVEGEEEWTCWVDVLIHRAFLSEFSGLLSAATTWAKGVGIDTGNPDDERRVRGHFDRMAAKVAVEDDTKIQRFARNGFRTATVQEAVPLLLRRGSVGGDEREVELTVLEKRFTAPGQNGVDAAEAQLAQIRQSQQAGKASL